MLVKRMDLQIFAVGALVGLVTLVYPGAQAHAQVAELTVRSSAFGDDEAIPLRNSAYGDNLSPEIMWAGAPMGTATFALVLSDSDVPMPNGFAHWVIYNIPGTATGLPGGIASDAARLTEPAEVRGTTQGLMGMRRPGYFGPRPPAGAGIHHYVFVVYALDADLELAEGLSREELISAIEGHVVGQGQLTGLYEGEQ